MSNVERPKCPFCGRKALDIIGNRYGFDVKEWRTTTLTLLKCRWCRKLIIADEAGNYSQYHE